MSLVASSLQPEANDVEGDLRSLVRRICHRSVGSPIRQLAIMSKSSLLFRTCLARPFQRSSAPSKNSPKCGICYAAKQNELFER